MYLRLKPLKILDMRVVRHTTPSYKAIIEALKKDMVKSNCPEGCRRIENIYWDTKTEELVWKIEE